MINRIVRMTFDKGRVNEFLEVFNHSKDQIASFPGCHGLKLLQDIAEPNVYYTFSLWLNDASLQQYRKSELFKSTWAKTRILFDAKPHAWSTTVVDNVK